MHEIKPRLIAARRSSIAPRHGALSALSPHEIAAPVIQKLLADAGVAGDDIGDVICANAIGPGGNVARSVALAAGLPERVAGVTIDRQCAGGLDAIVLAAALVRAGVHKMVIAGGVESYSQRPNRAWKNGESYDQAPFTPWSDRDPLMPDAAAQLAERLAISQHEQDAWALQSHAAALVSREPRSPELRGIVSVNGLVEDSFTRQLTPRLCARASQVSGSITAANMAVAADGAAFVLVAADGVGPRIKAGVTLGADPTQPGLAPIPAIQAALSQAELSPQDLRQAEIMEAFAVQAIACQRGAGIAEDIVNLEGGALARGHPIGASGAVLAVNLYHSEVSGPQLAAIASAGGIGSALILEHSS